MSNGAEHYELYLVVDGGADEEELDRQRIQLQTDLNDLDGVTPNFGGQGPGGCQGIDLVVIGGLAVALKQAGVFDAVVQVLKAWVERGNQRKEKRKIVIKRPDATVLDGERSVSIRF
jgi:hypothetical protein